MKAMNQKPELKEGQMFAVETAELNAHEVLAVSGGGLSAMKLSLTLARLRAFKKR